MLVFLVMLGIASSLVEAKAANRALLVGVTQYPALTHHPAVTPLRGPTNDVVLVRRVLERFGFASDGIVTLADLPGCLPPTKTNIVAALNRMALEALPGEQLVVYLSGHGTRRPMSADPENAEPDGRDEVFLPSDAQPWDEATQSIVNGLPDDEIDRLLQRLRERGAFVWFIADCCHSGTLSRTGSTAVAVARRIPSASLFPRAAVTTRRSSGIRSTPAAPRSVPGELPTRGRSSGGFVGMYACGADELTFEESPTGAPNETHGIFTYTLAETLFRTKRPITYTELMEQVLAAYRSRPQGGPTPFIHGSDEHRVVLGANDWPSSRLVFLQRRAGGQSLEITGGLLGGWTPGSVLGVLPLATWSASPKPIGYVEVVTAQPARASVRPCAFGDSDKVPIDSLPDGARCELVAFGPADYRLRIALQAADQLESGTPALGAIPFDRSLEALWASLTVHRLTQGRLERVPSSDQSDWNLASRTTAEGETRIVLTPAPRLFAGKVPKQLEESHAAGLQFPAPRDGGDSESITRLADVLHRVAKATSFLRMSRSAALQTGGPDQPNLTTSLRIHRERTDLAGEPWPGPSQGRFVRAGDFVSVTVSNSGPSDLVPTVFCVDAAFGIVRVPLRSSGKLRPMESVSTRPIRVREWPVGPEQIVTVGMRWSPQHSLDLSGIEQPRINVDDRGMVRGANAIRAGNVPVLPVSDLAREAWLSVADSHSVHPPLTRWLAWWNPATSQRESRSTAFPDCIVKSMPYRVVPRDYSEGAQRRLEPGE